MQRLALSRSFVQDVFDTCPLEQSLYRSNGKWPGQTLFDTLLR